MATILIIPFLDSNSKTLQPIDLKLNRVVGHHLGSIAFKIGAIWKNKMVADY